MSTLPNKAGACAVLIACALLPASAAQLEERNLDVAAIKAGTIRLQRGVYLTQGWNGLQKSGREGTWITVLDSDLKVLQRIFPAALADCSRWRGQAAAYDGKRLIAIAGICWNGEDQPVDKLIFYDLPAGRPERIVTTNPFECTAADFAPNGDLLCLGVEVPKARNKDFTYPLLYRYNPQGELLKHSISRGTIPARTPIELDAGDGPPAVLPWGKDHILLWLPAIPLLIAADAAGNELGRFAFPSPGVKEANLPLFITPGMELCGFVPNPDAPTVGRVHPYQMACLMDGQGNPFLPGSLASNRPIALSWRISPLWKDNQYPGRSTELVGFSGAHPVLWNRTTASLIKLPLD